MTDETGAPAGGDDIVIAAAPAETPSELSAEDAGRALAELRWKRNNPTAESAQAATAETESSQEESDPPQEAPAEEPDEADPEEQLPPIDPPRSWTKAEKERFQSLPRETQEYLHTREQERDRDVRRSQNEVADERKAVKAEREAAEKARQDYEAKLPALLKALTDSQAGSFSDIRSMDDARRMQQEDPFRFQAWQLHQMELQAIHAENDQLEQRKTQEKQSKRQTYEAEQNKALVEFVPEMADPKKASELRERAVAMLTDDLGLKNDQLTRWYADDTGHEILSNAGIQKLIADGLKYRDILKAPKAVAKPNLPSVQKPGAAPVRGSQASERVQTLQKAFEREPSVENATALRLARLRRA